MIYWHRLFGLALTDFFADSPYIVELEKDLSLRQQFLDVVILKKHPGTFTGPLPDGLDNLAEHNLLSYKSFQEPLDDWTLDELLGHFVNYRKQVSPARSTLLPKIAFRLYGVSTRFPQKLAEQVSLEPGTGRRLRSPVGYHPVAGDCIERDAADHAERPVVVVQWAARASCLWRRPIPDKSNRSEYHPQPTV